MTLRVDPFDLSRRVATIAGAGGILVEQERAGDEAARESLLDEAFGAARFTKTSQRLRAGRLPARGLALVGRDGGALVGSVRLWNVAAGGRPALLLGPLAVAGSHRSRGVGALMMRESLRRAAALGHKAVLLVGDAPYYARFGFDASLTVRLDLPGPVDRARFLAYEIELGALEGAAGLVVAAGARVRAAPQSRARLHATLRAA